MTRKIRFPWREKSKLDGLTMFRASFVVGEEVVLILDNDEYDWGVLVGETTHGVTIRKPLRGGSTRRTYAWDEVRFMSHDGFPVKKLLPGPSDSYLDRVKTTNVLEAIRQVFDLTTGDRERAERRVCRRASVRTSFGDPFLAEAARASLVNSGNVEEDSLFLETLVLESHDGAIAHLWDLSTVIGFAGYGIEVSV